MKSLPTYIAGEEAELPIIGPAPTVGLQTVSLPVSPRIRPPQPTSRAHRASMDSARIISKRCSSSRLFGPHEPSEVRGTDASKSHIKV
eukprot:scaffold654506_cov59-Prasinocladus_malaysianus.AAC.1